MLQWISKQIHVDNEVTFLSTNLAWSMWFLWVLSPYLISLQCLSYNCHRRRIFPCCLFLSERSWNRTGITILPTHNRHNLRILVSQLSNMKQSLPFLLRWLSHPPPDKTHYLNGSRSSPTGSWLRSLAASVAHCWHEFGNDFWWQDEACEWAAWSEVMSQEG